MGSNLELPIHQQCATISKKKKKKGENWNVNGSFMEYWNSLSFPLTNKLELALDEDNIAKSILCGNNGH